jgi:hypothetical protein
MGEPWLTGLVSCPAEVNKDWPKLFSLLDKYHEHA